MLEEESASTDENENSGDTGSWHDGIAAELVDTPGHDATGETTSLPRRGLTPTSLSS